MYYQRKTLAVSVLLWLMTTVFYYNIFNLVQPNRNSYYEEYKVRRRISKRHLPLKYNGTEDFLINASACYIPNYSKTVNFKEPKDLKHTCYKRAVFVEKTSEGEVTFRIDPSKINKIYTNDSFKCTYKFGYRSTEPEQEDRHLRFSNSKPFKNGDTIKLEEEIIIVECDLQTESNKKHSFYKDAYLIVKKKPNDERKLQLKGDVVLVKENWNVLLVGMDTMSRARAYHSLPKTIRYLKKHNWLDYRGYNKVGLNTFPNIMAMLAGINAYTAYSVCGHGMDQCRNLLIWEKFREAGYITAYGEDNLLLPDTFSAYKGFKVPPTDHYARPFFLLGEYRIGNVLCTRNKPSAEHLLIYASQFAQTYQNDSFFGYFWINSYSHNMDYLPALFEDNLISFIENLKNTGALNNTFVIFLSDHGVRFGPVTNQRASYYEQRLPMLFMWAPYEFQETYPEEYYNLQLNQNRLTTPYDLHATLWEIMRMTNRDVDVIPPKACKRCKSLTEEISLERTCTEASIDEKWCTCRNLKKANNETIAIRSLEIAVEYVQNRSRAVKTLQCTTCSKLNLKSVFRNDWYVNGNKTYYVIAFMFSPGDVAFEATVEHDGNQFNVLPYTDTISPYNTRGNCVINRNERAFCVCTSIRNCHKNKHHTRYFVHRFIYPFHSFPFIRCLPITHRVQF